MHKPTTRKLERKQPRNHLTTTKQTIYGWTWVGPRLYNCRWHTLVIPIPLLWLLGQFSFRLSG